MVAIHTTDAAARAAGETARPHERWAERDCPPDRMWAAHTRAAWAGPARSAAGEAAQSAGRHGTGGRIPSARAR